jgi:hypothetical protein
MTGKSSGALQRRGGLPGTSHRVPAHTPKAANARIDRGTKARIAYYSAHRAEIDERLNELEREWDIERTLEVNGSILALSGLALGVIRDSRWLLLPTGVVVFCLQHALQGWCPPLPLFRRLGIRTQREIDEERTILMGLRGDLDVVAKAGETDSADPGTLLRHIRREASSRPR